MYRIENENIDHMKRCNESKKGLGGCMKAEGKNPE